MKEFHPGSTFQETGPLEYRWSNETPAYALVGPGAAAIGWIPFFNAADQLPEGQFRDRWRCDLALREVFGTGNAEPPSRFMGPGDFLRDLERNDFRSAIAMDAPTLFLDQNQRPVLLQFLGMHRIGYTPKRIRAISYSPQGVGDSTCQIFEDGAEICIRLYVKFKLSFLGQLVAVALTHKWPPNATQTIEYRINPVRREVKVLFQGTAVPQLSGYVDWERYANHKIDLLAYHSFEDFVNSEGCKDATARTRKTEYRLMKHTIL